MTIAEYQAGMAEVEQKLVLISQLRAKLQAQRQQEAANLGVDQPLRLAQGERMPADVTGAVGAPDMSTMDTIDKFNPPGIGEYNPEQNAREAVSDVSGALASKPNAIAPAASTAVRLTDPSQIDVPAEMVPGNGSGIGRTIASSVDAAAGGLYGGLTMGLDELPQRARKAMEEHPALATVGGFAGMVPSISGSMALGKITVAGLEKAIPSLFETEAGQELVGVILRKAAQGVAGSVYYTAAQMGIAKVKGKHQDLNDILVDLADNAMMFAGGEALFGGIGGKIAAKKYAKYVDQTTQRGEPPLSVDEWTKASKAPKSPTDLSPEELARIADKQKLRPDLWGAETGTQQGAPTEVPLDLQKPVVDIYKTEMPATPKEQLAAVTPLEELKKVKAGEGPSKPESNVLIDAEEAARSEEPTRRSALGGVQTEPEPVKAVDRGKQVEELVDIDRRMSSKLEKGEDLTPEIEAIEKIREEARATVTPKSRLTELAEPVAAEAAPTKAKSDAITEVAEKAKIGDKIYYQLAKHRKPHKGTVSDIVTMPDGKVRVFLQNGDVTTPDRIKLPTKTVRLREYHAAFEDIPKEERGQVKVDAKRFDELLQEHYRVIDPGNESAAVWQSTLEETGKDFAAHSASLDRLRNLAGEKFGIDDLYNPVTRAKALPQLEKLIAEAPKEEAKGITAPKGGATTFESSSGKSVQMADVDVKPGDKLFMDGEWYDVEPSETPGNIKLKDGRTLDVDDTFDRLPVEKVVRPEPKSEMTEAGEQYLMPGTEGRQVPAGTIKTVGKKVNAPIEQGDLMQPGKIAKGNLPQDQVDAFAAAKPARATVTPKSRLTELADIERSRMATRHGKGGGPTTARTGLDPQIAIDIAKDLKSLSVIGAEKIVKGATKFKDWSRQMLDEYEGQWREMWGQDIREHLQVIWDRSKEQFHQLRGRYMAREHADYYKNELSQPQEYRPGKYSRIEQIADEMKANWGIEGPKGKEAKQVVKDMAWQEIMADLHESGVPMKQTADGQFIPLIPSADKMSLKGNIYEDLMAKATEQFKDEKLDSRAMQERIAKRAREIYETDNEALAMEGLDLRPESQIDEIAKQVAADLRATMKISEGATKKIENRAFQIHTEAEAAKGRPSLEKIYGKPTEKQMAEATEKAVKKYRGQQVNDPDIKRMIREQANGQFMAEVAARNIASKVKGVAGTNASRIMQSRRWALDVLERSNLKGVDAEELANMRRLFRTHPDLVVDKLDAMLKKHGIIIPFIRKSGTYVPADAMLHKYKEPAWGGEIQDTQRLIEEIDNAGSAEAKSVLRDQMGPAVRQVLVPFHKIFRQRSFWLADQEAVVKQLEKGLTEPQQEFTTKLLLKLNRGDGTAPTEELLNRSDIWDMFRKDYQPIVDKVEQLRAKISDRPLEEQASQIEALVTDEALKSGLLKKAQKAQNWHDDLFEQQNEMHRLRHEPEMPYRKFYGGAQILKKDVAAKLRKVADEHRELTETDIKDLGLGGEYLEQLREIDHEARAYRQFGRPSNFNNPRELQREIPRDPAIHEMKLPVLMRHYANQAARTIFTQSIVENNRVFADMLEQTGYPKASAAIHNWTSEAFAGQNNPIDAWFEKIGMSGYLNIAGKAKQGLIRSSFPLNIPWIIWMQSTNLESILAHEGPLNLGKAIKDVGNAQIRSEIMDRAHAYIAKSLQQGKVSSESFDQGMSGALRNADERWMGIKGTEKFSAKLDNAMQAENYFSEKLEEWMTLVAVRAGYLDGLKKGLKPGSDALWEHASAAGGRAATLFNTEDLPAILRSKAVRSHFPFQTFSFSMYNSMREIAGRTGTPPATAAERMKIVIGFLAAATVTNYATNKLAGRKPWDLSSGLLFYGSIFAPVLAPLTGDDAGTRGLPSPLGTTIEFGKALESAIAKGQFKKLRSWAMRYGTGMVGVPGGTEANRLWDGIEAAAREGVYDAKGKKMFPINGGWPKFQSVFGGPYSTEAGQEYLSENNKAAVNLQGATTRVGKEGQRLLKAIPGVGDFITSGGREKEPAAKRTVLMKDIFEAGKGHQEAIPEDERKDLQSKIEEFMWNGGQWNAKEINADGTPGRDLPGNLLKSLKDRYATTDEIAAIKKVWDATAKLVRDSGMAEEISTKRFKIQQQERAEKAAEKKALEAERAKRENPKPRRAFELRKAG